IALADSVPAAAGGALRLLVVNPDRTARAQVVEAFVDLPFESAEPWRTIDRGVLDRPVTFWRRDARLSRMTTADGDEVPFQMLAEEETIVHELSRFETPWALRARRVHLLWWAPSIPPCGYAAFDLELSSPDRAAAPARRRGVRPAPVVATDRTAENDLV